VLDAILPAPFGAARSDQIVTIAVVTRVHGDRDEGKCNRRTLPQHIKYVQERPAVLAARQTNHHAIAVLDQVVFRDRLGDFLGEPRLERRFV
jgi:hypothetical protein